MKRFALVLPFLLFAASALADNTGVHGQKNIPSGSVQAGFNFTDSTNVVIAADPTTKSLKTDDANRDRALVNTWPILTNRTIAVAGADSNTTPIYVLGYNQLKLQLKVTPLTGVNTTVRLAVQFREVNNNVSGDSVLTFATYIYGEHPRQAQRDSVILGVVASSGNRLVNFSAVDTSTAGHIFTGSATTPWSGEYTVFVNGNRSAPGSGVAAVAYSYPNTIEIPLDSFFGREVSYEYLQVRIRNMNANSPSVIVNANIKGFRR